MGIPQSIGGHICCWCVALAVGCASKQPSVVVPPSNDEKGVASASKGPSSSPDASTPHGAASNVPVAVLAEADAAEQEVRAPVPSFDLAPAPSPVPPEILPRLPLQETNVHPELLDLRKWAEDASAGIPEELRENLRNLDLSNTDEANPKALAYVALDGLVRKLVPQMVRQVRIRRDPGIAKLQGLSALRNPASLRAAAGALNAMRKEAQKRTAEAETRLKLVQATVDPKDDGFALVNAETSLHSAEAAAMAVTSTIEVLRMPIGQESLDAALGTIKSTVRAIGDSEINGDDAIGLATSTAVQILFELAAAARVQRQQELTPGDTN